SPGLPLDDGARGSMERHFRRSFAEVRVHTDARAAASARAVDAVAYTVGRDIVFGSGHFQPDSTPGRRLLAHELAHVVQQSRPASDAPGAAHEADADRAADAVDQPGRSIDIRESAGVGLSRLSVGEWERKLWAKVPDFVKPYVQPVAAEAKKYIDAAVP